VIILNPLIVINLAKKSVLHHGEPYLYRIDDCVVELKLLIDDFVSLPFLVLEQLLLVLCLLLDCSDLVGDLLHLLAVLHLHILGELALDAAGIDEVNGFVGL
jgi:hypothetical protein